MQSAYKRPPPPQKKHPKIWTVFSLHTEYMSVHIFKTFKYILYFYI